MWSAEERGARDKRDSSRLYFARESFRESRVNGPKSMYTRCLLPFRYFVAARNVAYPSHGNIRVSQPNFSALSHVENRNYEFDGPDTHPTFVAMRRIWYLQKLRSSRSIFVFFFLIFENLYEVLSKILFFVTSYSARIIKKKKIWKICKFLILANFFRLSVLFTIVRTRVFRKSFSFYRNM